ncbi:MAG TPA: SCO family protein [Pyrinomonadaceae bacterium]|jgi:protein SCO1/2|nr:SCO family protein [Pyrinomonadaceae bacterium]
MQKKFFLLFLIFLLLPLFSSCQKAETKNAAAPSAPSADAKRFPFKGIVVSVNKAKNEATISHDEIPGYMDAMTMPFPIKDTWVMDEISAGSQIQGELVVEKGDFYLEHVAIVVAPNPNQPPPPSSSEQAEKELAGKEVPNFQLTNQDGKRISTNDFRGKALAVTFIYTRCPLPNFCPLMSIRFSEIAMNLQKSPELKDKVRLLSITFDPAHDTPQVLKNYGAGYYNKDTKPDFTLWQLATGSEEDIHKIADFFGLAYQPDATDKTQIIHSLRTIVIDPQGKIRKVFAGNEWSSEQVLKEMQASLTADNK